MKLSIVSTLYYSENFIREFCNRVCAAASTLTDDFEIVLVNDGSPDRSLEKAKELIDEGLPIRLIDLSRNFGHHKAMLTGLRIARGEYVFLIDCDLEEEPEWLLEFWERLHSDLSLDVVYGVQKVRKGGVIERYLNGLYYNIFNALSDFKLPPNLLVVRLMKRAFVNSLLQFRETDVVFAALCELAGHKQRGIEVSKGHKQSTTYDLPRKIAMMMNSIISFSARPLEILFGFGLTISVITVIILVTLVYLRLVRGVVLEGWTSILLSIWFLGGLILMALGLVGIYMSRIFYQVKMRPLTIIKGDYYSSEKIAVKQGNCGHDTEAEFSELS